MKELLLCALKRHGKPATAGEVTDAAIALAQGAGWPRRSWAGMNTQKTAALFKGMHQRNELARTGSRTENSVERPLWTPNMAHLPAFKGDDGGMWDANAPMPKEPDAEGEDHPLHGTTSRQKYILFDVLNDSLALNLRHRTERRELADRHDRELCDHAAKVQRELMAAGIEGARA